MMSLKYVLGQSHVASHSFKETRGSGSCFFKGGAGNVRQVLVAIQEEQYYLYFNQVRLENIKLQNKINKQEMLIKQKVKHKHIVTKFTALNQEQLAEGLHMIDFEQLRINNVDLNEKIEERNEEILKLKRKVTSTVQVLAHLKEKLQFVQTENSTKKTMLKEVDKELVKVTRMHYSNI